MNSHWTKSLQTVLPVFLALFFVPDSFTADGSSNENARAHLQSGTHIPASATDRSQVELEVRLIEFDKPESKAVGFDWYVGQPMVGQSSAGTQPILNPGATQSVATVSGILTDPQFRTVIRALEQTGNGKLLANPSGAVLEGTSFIVSRMDGWSFEISPVSANASDGIMLQIMIKCSDGEYKGFLFRTTCRIKDGEAYMFGDRWQSSAKKEKGMKRLVLLVKGNVEKKAE